MFGQPRLGDFPDYHTYSVAVLCYDLYLQGVSVVGGASIGCGSVCGAFYGCGGVSARLVDGIVGSRVGCASVDGRAGCGADVGVLAGDGGVADGVPGRGVGESGGSSVGGGQVVGGDGHGGEPVVVPGVAAGGSLSGDVKRKGVPVHPRGENYERNRRNREKQKARAKQLASGFRQGFFSQCDSETQVKLRESRAELYVAENKRRAAEEVKKMKQMSSPVALVRDVVAMTALAQKCAKAAEEGSEVMAWASKVVKSVSESTARSAPSDVPSFTECVSVGSASSAAVLEEKKKEKKVAEYKLKLEGIEQMASYGSTGYDVMAAQSELRDEYADVLMTPVEKAKKDAVYGVLNVLEGKVGVNQLYRISQETGVDLRVYGMY